MKVKNDRRSEFSNMEYGSFQLENSLRWSFFTFIMTVLHTRGNSNEITSMDYS